MRRRLGISSIPLLDVHRIETTCIYLYREIGEREIERERIKDGKDR